MCRFAEKLLRKGNSSVKKATKRVNWRLYFTKEKWESRKSHPVNDTWQVQFKKSCKVSDYCLRNVLFNTYQNRVATSLDEFLGFGWGNINQYHIQNFFFFEHKRKAKIGNSFTFSLSCETGVDPRENSCFIEFSLEILLTRSFGQRTVDIHHWKLKALKFGRKTGCIMNSSTHESVNY